MKKSPEKKQRKKGSDESDISVVDEDSDSDFGGGRSTIPVTPVRTTGRRAGEFQLHEYPFKPNSLRSYV